jgi:hypothetical protein
MLSPECDISVSPIPFFFEYVSPFSAFLLNLGFALYPHTFRVINFGCLAGDFGRQVPYKPLLVQRHPSAQSGLHGMTSYPRAVVQMEARANGRLIRNEKRIDSVKTCHHLLLCERSEVVDV